MAPISPFGPVILSLPPPSPSLPSLSAHIIPFGLNPHRLLLTYPSGQVNDLITGPEDPKDHWERGRTFFGPIIGRFANRLPAGKRTIPVKQSGGGESRDVEVDIPEFSDQGVCLHGGPGIDAAKGDRLPTVDKLEKGQLPTLQAGPFDRLIWQEIEDATDARLFQDAAGSGSSKTAGGRAATAKTSAIWTIRSPHGDNGMPGELLVEVRISLVPSTGKSNGEVESHFPSSTGTLKVEYRAVLVDPATGTLSSAGKSSPHTAATPLNLTHHWFFNLSASTQPKEKNRIDDHRFLVTTPQLKTLGLDAKMVPNGTLEDLPQGHEWLSTPHPLGKRLGDAMPSGGYDHFYTWGPPHTSSGKGPQVIYSSPSAGVAIAFTSDQAGVQLYTAGGQPDPAQADPEKSGGKRKALHYHSGTVESDRGGISHLSGSALEFGYPHATFLHDGLQDFVNPSSGGAAAGQWKDTLLRWGDVYSQDLELDVRVA